MSYSHNKQTYKVRDMELNIVTSLRADDAHKVKEFKIRIYK